MPMYANFWNIVLQMPQLVYSNVENLCEFEYGNIKQRCAESLCYIIYEYVFNIYRVSCYHYDLSEPIDLIWIKFWKLYLHFPL